MLVFRTIICLESYKSCLIIIEYNNKTSTEYLSKDKIICLLKTVNETKICLHLTKLKNFKCIYRSISASVIFYINPQRWNVEWQYFGVIEFLYGFIDNVRPQRICCIRDFNVFSFQDISRIPIPKLRIENANDVLNSSCLKLYIYFWNWRIILANTFEYLRLWN